ncbi:MAG: 6,7-dimethyl-8-ribityllumazine synthase [candidate division KSB1 bacterium]|nr:6,7-dimethyl-8-ribityllumazine synthase [candidate division KSB1 bacterium]MDZ7336195.1 6,7-dimethyl-8-ribityllumazine synthase [candidate division KSB1 bacterium]MDZ7356938.1 6,7-dimethyl-8-ribityllumazine synthase [candidate division KSB1 bacterium]MDZ7376144.1 6,7-dimethyl-8-ribityllumazine synthase [candidate division KSB1 bacterium]MDZ7400107.1 6,7-dimethyl-8-ribityllumazine synthase [candidate division KSB1 bacterium]
MPKILQGKFVGKGKRFGIVVSRFNEFISSKLLEGALDCLQRHEVDMDQVDIAWVPGSFEIPLTALRMASSNKYDAVVCLGAVIRGATPHFEYIAAEVTKGIAQVNLQTGVPTIYGVITADTLEQAIERAGTKAGNKGWDAAMSAMEMANLFENL